MKKIIVFNLISVDGFFAGEDANINWHNVDDEFNQFAVEQMRQIGTLMFGRTTYEIMRDYWPAEETNPKVSVEDKEIAHIMNNVKKIVFSRTLGENEEKENWKNVLVKKGIEKEEVENLKETSEKDIYIFGSGQIAQALTKLGLVDEYRLMVNPIALGKGKSLFVSPAKFKLLQTKQFGNGNVLLYYKFII